MDGINNNNNNTGISLYAPGIDGGSSYERVLSALECITATPLKHFTLARCENINIGLLLENAKGYYKQQQKKRASSTLHSPRSHTSNASNSGTVVVGAGIAQEENDRDDEWSEFNDSFYLCLGKHEVFLIDRPAQGISPHIICSFRYSSVMNIVVSPNRHINNTSELFGFQFYLNTPQFINSDKATITASGTKLVESIVSDHKVYHLPDVLAFRCSDYRRFLDEFTVCYKTDYMFLNWKPHVASIEIEANLDPFIAKPSNEETDLLAEMNIDSFTLPFDGEAKDSLNGYFFFYPNEFTRISERRIGLSSATFAVKPKDLIGYPFFEISFEPIAPLDFSQQQQQGNYLVLSSNTTNSAFYQGSINADEVDVATNAPAIITSYQKQIKLKSLKSVVEHVANDFGEFVQDYCIIGKPSAYFKTLNLTGDPASWECWEMHLRTFEKKQMYSASELARRIEMRDIAIVAARRKYIPPTMDNFQDVLLIYYGQPRKFVTPTVSINDPVGLDAMFIKKAERIMDTISPESLNYDIDEYIIQAKADALQFDEDTYKWFSTFSKIRIFPKIYPDARRFCEAIHSLLIKWGIDVPLIYAPSTRSRGDQDGYSGSKSSKKRGNDKNVLDEAQQLLLQQQEDPFYHSTIIEKKCLTEEVQHLDEASYNYLIESWRSRTWRYLAFCVNGGMFPGILTIENMVASYFELDRKKDVASRNKIASILDHLLYLRETNGEYKAIKLSDKVTDPVLMRSFTFNSIILEKLLETNYIKAVLDQTENTTVYPKFLVRLLEQQRQYQQDQLQATTQKEETGATARPRRGSLTIPKTTLSLKEIRDRKPEPLLPSLQYVICKKLIEHSVALSQISATSDQQQQQANTKVLAMTTIDDIGLQTIIPSLIDILIRSSDDSSLQVLCVVALVNFSKNNQHVKSMIMTGSGTMNLFVQLIQSKHDDLVRHMCSLINNLITKSPHNQKIIASHGMIKLIFRLLQMRPYEPRFRSIQILTQACAVLAQFASDSSHREEVTSCIGYEHVKDMKREGARFKRYKSIKLLIDLLNGSMVIPTETGSSMLSETVMAASSVFRNSRQEDGEQLQINILILLKNLSVESPSTKEVIARIASGTLLKLTNESKNKTLTEVALRCILALCFNNKIACLELRNSGLNEVIEVRKVEHTEVVKQIQAKLIQSVTS